MRATTGVMGRIQKGSISYSLTTNGRIAMTCEVIPGAGSPLSGPVFRFPSSLWPRHKDLFIRQDWEGGPTDVEARVQEYRRTQS